MAETYIEKRRFPRVKAPIYFSLSDFSRVRRKAIDISLGGMRIYTNDYLEEEKRYDLKLFLPNGHSLIVNAQVRWKKVLPPDSNAFYDIGLEFINPSPVTRNHLNLLIKQTSS